MTKHHSSYDKIQDKLPKTLIGAGQVLSFWAWILKILISPPVPSLWYWYLKTNVQPASPGVRHMRAPVSSSFTGSSSTTSTYGIINVRLRCKLLIARAQLVSRDVISKEVLLTMSISCMHKSHFPSFASGPVLYATHSTQSFSSSHLCPGHV